MSLRFQNTQEVGDTSEWDSVFTNGPRITVTAGGLNGSSWKITGQTTTLQPNRYEMDMSLLSSLGTTWRFGWRVEMNSITYGTATRMITTILGPSLFLFYIKESGSNHVIEVDIQDDAASVTTITGTTTFADAAEVTIEIKITQAASSVSADGTYEIFLNGISEGTATGIDNFDRFNNAKSDEFEVNAPNMTGESGFSGDIFQDDVTFRDDNTVIFPPPAATVTHIWLSTDGGGTYSDIGDVAWGANVVGGVVAVPGTAYQTIFAAVGTNLYKTTNGGTAWTLETAVGYEVDFIDLEKDNTTVFLAKRDAAGTNRASLWDSVGASLTHINTGKSTTGGATSGGDVV